LSWECWTPQIYAGNEIKPIAHVINDDDQKRELRNATLNFHIRSKGGREFSAGKISLPAISYFATWSKTVPLKIPADLPTGEYWLSGSIEVSGEIRSTNSTEVFIAGQDWKNFTSTNRSSRDYAAPSLENLEPTPVGCYDPAGATAAALGKLGIAFERVTDISALPAKINALVLGVNPGNKSKLELQRFVQNGGRVLCLISDSKSLEADWLPQKISFFTSSPNDVDYPPVSRPFREHMNVNLERPDHPVFRGLNRRQFSLWSDYSNWDQTQKGFPKVYPVTAGFKLNEPAALARTAILADYDRGLEGIALCEMFDGKGSVILSGFDLVNRAGLDPVADRLLANLVAYTESKTAHEIHPLIEKPIRWGDYPSERGVASGSLNGLLVNAEWIRSPANPRATPLSPNTGAWNMLPGEQFSPRGRHPFGAYSYSTASSLKPGDTNVLTGEGFFWARIPAGKKFVITTVKNPSQKSATLKVFLSEQRTPGSTQVVAPGRTVRVRTPLVNDGSAILIRYAGEKKLVLLETAFE
ncbi:MAG: hypothetical protein ABI042_14660, partial [Verrucomicrobiota bacterium]